MVEQIKIGLLLSSLLFYADFDSSFNAVFSKGNGNAVIEPDRYTPSLTIGKKGRFGEAVEFKYEKLDLETVWTKDTIRYEASDNFPYSSNEPFEGSIGMWIMIDIDELKKRELIWLDPFHLLADEMDISRVSGKIWMDFVTKELSGAPLFRFGATLPKNHRNNPKNSGEGHIITLPGIDFKQGNWHHIVGTWRNMNNFDNTGIITLYVDGLPVDKIDSFSHPLSWNIEKWEMRIGIGFKGLIDDFFVMNRYLTEEEVSFIHASGISLGKLLKIHNTKQQ